MAFLPNDYTDLPFSSSDYMKLEEGVNSIRILSHAVIGWKYWTIKNIPVRSKTSFDEMPADIKTDNDGKKKIQHFWAFVVWDNHDEKIKVFELTQKTIMVAIKGLIDNPKWGDPHKYDIVINKVVNGGKTSYTVQAEPPIGEPDQKILDAYSQCNIDLSKLFTGESPFLDYI